MRTRTLSVAVATATALATMPVANADPAPFTYVELNQPSSQTVAVEAQFNLTADSEVGIAGVRALRADMWDKNVPFNGMPLRDVAAQSGFKTRDAYVNAVQPDYGFSLIALQRGVEASKLYNHKRMYNSTCYGDCGSIFTATINGIPSSGENLNSISSIADSIPMWGTGEEAALRAADGKFNNANGHLYNLLNPGMRYFGFAGVTTSEGQAAVATFGNLPTGVKPQAGGAQTQTLYRPAGAGENVTAAPQASAPQIEKSRSEKAAGQAPRQVPGTAAGTKADVGTVLGILAAVISLIGAIAGTVMQFGALAQRF